MLYTETTNIKYDINKHQYYITDEYLQDNYGFSLGDELSFDNDNDIDKFIKRASNVIYTFIHKANPDTANIKDYMIASDIGLRDTVAESIGEFLYSIAQYGYDNSSRTGIDSKVQVSYRDLETAEIPILSMDLLYSSGLLFRGTYKLDAGVNIDELKASKEY